MTVLSDRMRNVRPSATKAMTAEARKLAAAGHDIVTLSQGEPDFDTPAMVAAAAKAAIDAGHTRYTEVAGVRRLRDAVAEQFRREYNLRYAPEQISVGAGAKQMLFNAWFATLNSGDEVVIPTPCWPSYPEMVTLAGGAPRLVPCLPEQGFKLTSEALGAAIRPRTRWLLINSPCNPTGAVYGADELRALADVLRRHPRVWVLSDDIYVRILFEGEFASLAAVAPDLVERIVIVDGVSKSDAMTGWRIGFAAGPAELIEAMNTIQSQTTSHAASVSQYAALAAVEGGRLHVARFRDTYLRRRDLVLESLAGVEGLDCLRPAGAFYVFVGCAGLMGRVTPDGEALRSDEDLARYLLRRAGVAVVPGTAFHASPYLRLSFAGPEDRLREGCRRIEAACAELEAVFA